MSFFQPQIFIDVFPEINKYLGNEQNISKLYIKYKDYCPTYLLELVNKNFYHIFNSIVFPMD